MRGGATDSVCGSSEGCGGGCGFLIFVFVGGFTYFTSGFAYNFQRRGLRGKEAIPHKDFWVDVPFLVKDGMADERNIRRSYVETDCSLCWDNRRPNELELEHWIGVDM
eukprot:gene19330-biopygen17272